MQLCFNKTLFTKMGKGPDLVCELSLPNPSLEDISGFFYVDDTHCQAHGECSIHFLVECIMKEEQKSSFVVV